jgi:hypothetical protein
LDVRNILLAGSHILSTAGDAISTETDLITCTVSGTRKTSVRIRHRKTDTLPTKEYNETTDLWHSRDFAKAFLASYIGRRSVSNNNHGCCKSWESVETAGWTTEGLITSGLSFLWSTRMCLLADDYSVQPCCSRINESSFHFFPVEDQFSRFFSRWDIF